MSIKNNFPSIRPSLSLHFAKTKKLDPRIDFTRASTGTYYDGETVAKAEENLLLYSQEFETGWNAPVITVTSNSDTAPDGTETADLITVNSVTTNQGIYQAISTPAGITISVWIKAGTATYAAVQAGTTRPNALFNLSNGTVAYSSGCTASIKDYFGDGSWYRCILENTTVSGNNGYVIISPVDSDIGTGDAWGNNNSAIGASILIWGAQLEQRDTVTAYTPTNDQPITRYQPVLLSAPANTARFDHDPVTAESKGLLIEEQRTNLFSYSEDFANTDWSKTRSSIVSNTIIAPDGTLTGDKLIENTDTGEHQINWGLANITLTQNIPQSFSLFAKKGERTKLALRWGVWIFCTFDLNLKTANPLVNSTYIVTNFKAEDIGNNWIKCQFTVTNTGSTSLAQLSWRILDSSGNQSYTGDGYSGIYIWGAQLEEGAFPTSYIKTEGSQVTRSVDSASMTGENFSSWYRADEGTLYAEASSFAVVSGSSIDNGYIATITDGTDNSRIQILIREESQSFAHGGFGVLDNNIINSNTNYKISFGLKNNSAALSVNGASPSTTSTGIIPSGMIDLTIGDRAFRNDQNLCGHIKKLSYYPERLTNEQLQALTKD